MKWIRLTPGTEDKQVVMYRRTWGGDHVFHDGFQDEGELRQSVHHQAQVLSTEELAEVPLVKELLRVSRFILKDATEDQDGYARLERGADEEFRKALEMWEEEEPDDESE